MLLQHLQETAAFIASKTDFKPEVAIILGTGLGRLAQEIDVVCSIDYAEIPHFPTSTVESHSGKLIFGMLSGKRILAMQGRFHFYEGYTMQQITYPIRLMKIIGIKFLFISNAAGALNPAFKKGELMLIEDHINLLPQNPLVGKNEDSFGPRFPDMSEAYHKGLSQIVKDAALAIQLNINRGVYAAVMGPNLETRAEYRFLARIGADAVGMSTVPEVIVANHCDLPCAAISVLTDECNPEHLEPVNITDILAIAAKAEVGLTALLKVAISNID